MGIPLCRAGSEQVLAGSQRGHTASSIGRMKISVSLPQEDVAFVDEYAAGRAVDSRSAVIHAAIQLLRESVLEEEYLGAWDEWYASDDAELWDRTAGDGISDEAR